MNFYSQYDQDRYMYENFFRGKEKGFFVDIGASDGITISNTKFFEELGWDGLCVEARGSIINELRNNRNCIVEHACLSSSNCKKEFIDIIGYGSGLSGLTGNCDINRIFNGEGKNSEKVIEEVQCCTINFILKKHSIFEIDYMSVDVEGAEYDILSVIDFKNIKIDFFTIENNDPEDSSVRDFMNKNGYDLVGRLNIDEVFKRR